MCSGSLVTQVTLGGFSAEHISRVGKKRKFLQSGHFASLASLGSGSLICLALLKLGAPGGGRFHIAKAKSRVPGPRSGRARRG